MHKQTVVFGAMAFFLWWGTGCKSSHGAECQELIAAINSGSKEIDQGVKDWAAGDSSRTLTVVLTEKIAGARKRVTDLGLFNEDLKGFARRFVDLLDQQAQASQDLEGATSRWFQGDPDPNRGGAGAFMYSTLMEQALLSEVNGACGR